MKKIMLAAMMICGAVALAGCNTVAGFGTDLKKGANHVGTALESIGSKGQSSRAPAKSAESKPVEDKVSPSVKRMNGTRFERRSGSFF